MGKREGNNKTRRDVLQRLVGAAAAVPLTRLTPKQADVVISDVDLNQGLIKWIQKSPAQQVERLPAVQPAYWQPPYRREPAIPQNAVVLPILMYHRATVSRVFEAQLVAMLTAGYRPLSLHSALKGLLGEEELPAMPIVLTFDDGWRIQYDAVFPVLKQYRVPATFFVMPGFHERQEGYMDWDQLAAIADFGMEVESHTLNHADLPRLAKKDWGAVLAEVVISKQLLDERLGRITRYFDYPLGYENDQIRQLVRDAGYEAAVTIGPGVHQSVDTLYALRRIRVEAWNPWYTVAHKLNWYGAGPNQLNRNVHEPAKNQ